MLLSNPVDSNWNRSFPHGLIEVRKKLSIRCDFNIIWLTWYFDYHHICIKRHTMGATSVAELLIFLEHLCSTRIWTVFRDAQSSIFCVVLCRSLLVLLSFLFLAIVWCLHLRFAASYKPFGMFIVLKIITELKS